MKINRFPKMAALQKERALKLGFDENMAKAIGIAEAVKYAIFKNLIKKGEKEKIKELTNKNLDNETFKIFKLQALNGLPFVGDKVYTAQDYDRYFLRFNENVKKAIEEWAKNIIENCDKSLLENENKFFNLCWKPHRDELSEI